LPSVGTWAPIVRTASKLCIEKLPLLCMHIWAVEQCLKEIMRDKGSDMRVENKNLVEVEGRPINQSSQRSLSASSSSSLQLLIYKYVTPSILRKLNQRQPYPLPLRPNRTSTRYSPLAVDLRPVGFCPHKNPTSLQTGPILVHKNRASPTFLDQTSAQKSKVRGFPGPFSSHGDRT
jgi:hypothetical protein